MKKLLFILISFTFFTMQCSDDVLNPELEPGKRDYIWTVDTLDIYSIAGKIWGSSPYDIWTINESDFYHNFWHYDGISWSTDGVHRFLAPHALWGFSNKNIYVGSSGGQIWHFNGEDWNQLTKLSSIRSEYVGIENIWGESPNDFYAVGSGPDSNGYYNESFISHFNGSKWTNFNTDGLIGDIVHLYKNIYGKTYFRLSKIGGVVHVDSTIIYEYKSGKYKKLYSSLEVKGKQSDISLINGQVYFILGNKIALRTHDTFVTFLDIENSNFYHRIWGRNSKDIFLLMTDGLAHYNGDNIEYIFYFTYADAKPWTQIFGAAIFENEVFFTTYEPPTNLKLIYHGILKNNNSSY